jgi:crotonobetainyl-CoA:carnitine CoA-transferase CaiB-like acyl-CoA transferase
MMLGDMGADVVKIEAPLKIRQATTGSSPQATDTHRRATSYFNRGKRSVTLNLKSRDGRQIMQRMIASADILVEGFRPGVMARLGLSYASTRRRNPRLIYASLSGYGQDGPYKELPGHDLNYLAMSGALGLMGAPSGSYPIPLNLVADYGGAALHGAAGILLALVSRQNTGRGQRVDISYLDSSLAILAATPQVSHYLTGGTEPKRGTGIFCGGYAYYGVYDTSHGGPLTVACIEPHLWHKCCDAIGRPHLKALELQAKDFYSKPGPSHRRARSELQALFKSRSRPEWIEELSTAGVCVAPVNTVRDALREPQLRHRGMISDVADPDIGQYMRVGVAIKLSETPGRPGAWAPFRGQHTDEVLRNLNVTQEEVEQLRQRGVV